MKANRNDPCPCGSGKKYKKCCLANEESVPAVSAAEELMALAIEQHQAGQLDLAAQAYRAILAQQPQSIDALHLLGVVRSQQGDFSSAIELIRKAVALAGDHRDLLYNLGDALRGARQDAEAIAVYQRILPSHPDDVDVLNNLALACRGAGRNSEALEYFVRAQKQAPNDPDLMGNIGLVLSDMNRVDESIAVFRATLALNPAMPEVLNNLGSALQNTGDTQGAIQAYQQALAYRPDYVEAHSNLIFSLDFVEAGGVELQQAERKRWSDKFVNRVQQYGSYANSLEPGRKLKIGYVSPDFRHHSAAYAFAPLILDYDSERFEVYCYSNSVASDDMTERFKQSATHWRAIYGLSDAQAAAQIHADGIDILVDLAGHSRNNRLGVMAYKPAPIQASGWGHANGTGVATIDYLFSDPVYIPPDEAAFYQEKLLYLPCVISYLARQDAPAVTALPASQNGYLTFGSFSRLSKISPEVLDLWADLLQATPHSRMLFKAPELNSDGRRKELLAHMQSRGVDATRIELQAGTPWLEHVKSITTADIALDPYPHGGGVSVLDCLWMGVPVLAVQRPTPAGRVAASILKAHDLGDWVAADKNDFLALGQSKAKDIAGLAALRAGLRERVANAPVANGRTYAAAVESHYQTIWQGFTQSAAGR